MKKSPQLGTRTVWAGEEEYLMQGATQVPVVHSVSFGYRDVDEWLQIMSNAQKKRGLNWESRKGLSVTLLVLRM